MRVLAIVGALGCVAAWDDLILPPVTEGKTGAPAVLLFGQGAGIVTSLYQSLGEAIQAAAPFPLWFGSPQCQSNSCAVPGTLKSGMERIKSAMVDQGLDIDNSTRFYYGGHSLGGAMMPDYVHDEALDDASAMVLMGSFLTRKWRTGVTSSGRPQYEFPVPTLTIGTWTPFVSRWMSAIDNSLRVYRRRVGRPVPHHTHRRGPLHTGDLR